MENLEDLIEKETKIRKSKCLKKWSISANKEKSTKDEINPQSTSSKICIQEKEQEIENFKKELEYLQIEH